MAHTQQAAEAAQMEKLQRQMLNIQDTMIEHASLRRKLEDMMDAKAIRTERTLERVQSRNSILQEDIDRKFGERGSPSPIEKNRVLEQVMSLRTKEFQKSQAKKANHLQNLVEERQRILDARNRLKERKERYRSLPSPVESDPVTPVEMRVTPSYRSVHSSQSHVKHVANAMPLTVDRIWSIRDSLAHDYERLRKPYEGELGIGSYEKWQLPDYFMVRKLVNEFVEDFLLKHTPPDEIIFERDMRLHLENNHSFEMDSSSTLLSERKTLMLVVEELMLQVTKQMTREVGLEVHQTQHLYRRLSSNAFIKSAEIQATGNPEGRDPSEDEYDILTRAFRTLQKDRDRSKQGIWMHSQIMSHPVVVPVKPLHRNEKVTPPKQERGRKRPTIKPDSSKPSVADEIAIDPDVVLLRHGHLMPEHLRLNQPMKIDDRNEKQRKFWRKVYKKKELNYWAHLRPFMFSVALPKRGQGVELVVPSPDHMMVAVGMSTGDIYVLNTLVEPWQVVKVDIGPQGQGSVIALDWSLDSSSLVAIRQSGMYVFSVNGTPASKQALKALGIAAPDGKQVPLALIPVTSLLSKNGDLNLHSGPLSQTGNGTNPPTITAAHFFPTLTYLTSQSVICLGLQSGDIFKIDVFGMTSDINRSRNILLKPTIPPQDEDEENTTPAGINVEVFRQHQYPIVLIGCIGNIGKLVSMDTKGFINIWKYATDHVTQNGCYVPESKYRIDFNKLMYTPSSANPPKVVFTDRKRSKSTTQEVIAWERREVQATLDHIQLGYPWHVSHDSPGLETSIYIPAGGSLDSAAMVNIVIRHIKTKQLSTYMTHYYSPVKVGCSKMLSATLSPTGSQLVIILLYPAFPPKVPHLMVLIINLLPVKLQKFRYDHPITENQHRDLNSSKLTCSAAVSQVVGSTGAQYLFLTIGHEFRCVSMATGSSLLMIDNPNRPRVPFFKGLVIDEKQFPVSASQKVGFVGNMGSLYAIFFDSNSTNMRVLRLEDGNNQEDSIAVWKAFQQWERFEQTPMELRINAVDWALPDMKHKLAEMRSLILNLDFGAEPVTDEDTQAAKKANYSVLQDEVTAQGLLMYL